MSSPQTAKRLWISASKMRMYDECAGKIYYKYIEKIPEIDRGYFKRGREIEDLFIGALKEGKLILGHTTGELAAKALLDNEELMSLLRGRAVFHHREYRLIQCKDCKHWNDLGSEKRDPEECEKCLGTNFENYGFNGITDVEAEGIPYAIDLKTSSASRSEQTVKDNKRQAKMYAFIKTVTGGEPVNKTVFASVNVKTLGTSVNTLEIASFDDFREKVDQLRMSFDLKSFPLNPSRQCNKFCPFAKFCPKDPNAIIS